MPGTGEQPAPRPGEPPTPDTTTPTPSPDSLAQPTELGGATAATADGTLFGDLSQPILPILTNPQANQQFFTGPISGAAFGVSNTPITGLTVLPNAAASSVPRSASGQPLALVLAPASAAPLPFHTAFKISENENPAPQTRVFAMYNYYSDVQASGQAFGAPNSQVHREIGGLEYAFWDGTASLGFRVPAFQTHTAGGFEDSEFGDLTIIYKYAFYRDRETRNLLSAGLVLTVPTGPSLPLVGQSNVNSTIFQPYVGGIWHFGDAYVVNFTSLAVPTDSRDITLFFESIGVGYKLYHSEDPDAYLTSIVPQAELHVNVPLNHEGLDSLPIGFSTSVDFTGGCYFTCHRATIGLAAGTPLTGPKPYGVEGVATLNYRF
jgi:hypothetical protein